ncbi:hypothetical protein [Streptomyces sp. NPDC093225]|uniref:hypothetical protein n=1 Tax=Streptomyces sp. NPDC093225 TaxID=3366034 RepID=UPI0038149E3C
MCALVSLAAALFLCGSTGRTGASGHPVAAGGPGADAAHRLAAAAGPHSGAAMRAAFLCPYDLPGCSPFAHATPGVLTGPPAAATVPAVLPPAGAGARPAGRPMPAGPPARAPDLHVLQVLRT